MKTYEKLSRVRALITVILAFVALPAASQMSYEEFHAKYIPTYETILPDLELVQTTNNSDAETGSLIVQLLMQQAEAGDEDSKLKVIAILTSCKREVVAAILKEMDTETAVNAINYVNEDWQREIMFFVDKTTYHNIAPNLYSILLWPGPQGPLGPKRNSFAPVYAGIGADFGWGGYKGVNEYINAYNGWTTKTGPGGTLYNLDTPVSKMGTHSGFTAFGGFYIKGKGFLEVNIQNRTAKSTGGGTTPSTWSKDFKFNSTTFNLAYLKSPGDYNQKVRLAYGWGFHFQTGGTSVRTSFSPEWDKQAKGISAGLSYNAGVFINPFDDIPVVIGLRAYVQMNLLKYDMTNLETTSPQIPYGGGDIENMQSVMNTVGVQFQVMYKFGKPGDDRVFTDFDTEVTQNMDNHVNTTYTEILPIISPDGKTLYFIRSDHPKNTNGSLRSQDVWVADISNGIENATATHLPSTPFNSQTYNMIAGVSPDGNTMLIKGAFDSNGEVTKRGYSMIHRTKDGWSKPVALEIDQYDEMSNGTYTGAYWTQDGKHIVLSMSEITDDDEQDLYVTHLKEDGTWTKPVQLGPTINAADTDEHSPFLASDGKTLYFSTNKEGGLGSNDIYMTQREDDTWTKWTTPINMGDSVNTDSWDAYYTIDAKGEYAYKASDKNSKGKEDIVRIKLAEEVQPDPVVLITGRVLNKKTNEPLEAIIDYNGMIDGKNYGVARTNPTTGEYTIVLPYGVNYDFSAGAANFIGISENLDLTGVGEYQEIKRDLYLVPIEVGATVRLNNIFFETGKAELKTESYTELNRVIEFLKANPNVKIELSGHTDNVGNADMNKSLSQRRADSVLAYLVANGIDASRLVAKGYGMEKPVADNTTDEGKASNRRVEFTILSN
jgi:OmpA-OmpF porin, OOP family